MTIRNQPVTLAVQCSGCAQKIYARTPSPERGRALILAGGWMIANEAKGLIACSIHNPARTEFIGYFKGATDAVNEAQLREPQSGSVSSDQSDVRA